MALAGAIVPGVIRYIVALSAQADVFGVGTTVIVGSRLVVASGVTSGWIVPGGGPAEISGVESVKAALLSGASGKELHTVVDELPTGGTGISFRSCWRRGTWEWFRGPWTLLRPMASCIHARAVDPETLPDALVSIGTGGAMMEGGGKAATGGGGGAGTVEPGISVINDVAGCADKDRSGGGPLAVDAERSADAADTVDAADGIGPVVPALPTWM